MSTPIEPMILEELGIPGRSKDPVSTDPDVWGINIAAALGNFPCHGLQCQAGPWGNMAEGDRLTIFWGTGQNVWLEIVNKDEVKTQLRMFVPPKHMVDGKFSVSYSVKPLGASKDEPSEVMQVLVKLTRPGGHDDNGDGGHSKLIMIIPQDILDDGINKESLEAGVKISIGEANGTPPYPYAAAGDICRLSWGGIYVFSEPLTQEQAEGKTPIIITITEEIIKEAGDAPGVAVVFEVYDCVFNRSEDWSPEQRIKVAVDESRLVAPLLKGTVNNVLDVDELGDADGTVQVIATDTSTFKVGDEVFIRIKGTPVEGPPIDWEPSAGVELNSVPSIMEIKAPNAVLRQLAKSQITLSYRLEKADGSADLKSKSQFIRAIGEVQRLAAPEVLDENSGALDPTLPQIRLEIPFDKSFVEGQVLQPAMLGTTPGRKPYLPELPTRPITHNDIVAAKPLLYNIDGKHLAPVDGGTAEFYYQLLIPSAVLTTLDAFEASRAIRESIHSDILRVGEPRQELPQPKVAGVVDDVLPADTAGTTATVIYKETVNGDEIFMSWLGSITGQYPDSIKLNEFTAGKEVPFTIPAAMIKDNEGGTVEVKYEIKRAAGGTSYSDTLKFSVGVALDLTEPKIKQAPNDSSLDPLNAQSALTAVINYVGMLVGDKIIVRWIGATGTLPAGSHTTDPWPVTTVGPQEIPLAVSVLAFNLAKSITLNYSVTRATQDPKDSRTLTLAVLQLRVDLSHSPKIIQAAGGGDGTELDVSTLTAAATLRGGFWPHIASGQRVWMEIQGTKKDDTEYKRVVWRGSGNAVNGTWISQGYLDASLPLADLQSLKDLSPLNVSFMATPDRSMDENLALSFPLRTYIVKAMEPYVLSFTDAIYTIAPAARLRDVRLQLRTAVDGIAVPNTPVCLTLPEGFRFADGSGQSRTFHTDLAGDINVSRIKGHANPGKYSLTARVNNFLAQASVDIRTPGTSGKIILNNSAVWLDMTPDGLELYVTIADTREVVIIDTQSLVIVETLKTDTYPCTVAISSDGAYAYLTNFDETSVDRFNVQTRSLVNRLNIEAVPHSHSVVFAPDNSRAYMTCRGSSAVAEIDMQSQTEINRISVGSCPNHIIINPSGDRLYVSNANSNTVSVIDRRDLSVIAEIPVNPAPYVLTMHPDRKRILVCSLLLPKVDIIDIESFSVIGTINVQAYPYGTVVSPNGQRIYICNRGSTIISVVDASTLEVIDTLQVEAQPISLTFSPDGKLLFVCHHASNEVLVLEITNK